MNDASDADLLKDFAQRRSDETFRRLVERHSGMVYAACARSLSPQDAEDATQAVFILLAQRASAGSLSHVTALGGWLYRASRLVAAEIRRGESRRTRREATAAAAHAEGSSTMTQDDADAAAHVRPHLDDAISRLRQKQQDAIVLHYLQGKSIRETALTLRCSEDSAKKRIAYGIEKLRELLARNGIALSVTALVPVLQSEAARHAPTALLNSCAALSRGAAAGKPALLAKGVSKTMLLIKAKIAAAVAVLLLGSSLTVHALSKGETPPVTVRGDKDNPPAPLAPPPLPVVAAEDVGWDADPFAGTRAIDVTHGGNRYVINDPAMIRTLVSALHIDRIANKQHYLSIPSATFVFDRGPRGPLNMSLDSDFNCSIPGASLLLDAKFFNLLSAELAKQALVPVKLNDFALAPGKRKPELTPASLKSGIKSVTLEYDVADQGRRLNVTDPNDLAALTRAFQIEAITPRKTLDKKLTVWAQFDAELADGSQLSASFEDTDIVRTNIGNLKLNPVMRETIAAIVKKFEGREIDILRDNPGSDAERIASEKATALLRTASNLTIVSDKRRRPINATLTAEELQKTMKALKWVVARPDEKLTSAPETGLELKLTPTTGDPVQIKFLERDKLPSGLIMGQPIDLTQGGVTTRVWVDNQWEYTFSTLLRERDDTLEEEQARKTTARVMMDFDAFKKQVTSVKLLLKMDGDTLIYFISQPAQLNRLLALLKPTSSTPGPVTLTRNPEAEISLTPGVGFDLVLAMPKDGKAEVARWGTLEFSAPIIPELIRIAKSAAVPGPAAAKTDDNF